MLLDNDIQSIDIQTVRLKLSDSTGRLESHLAQTGQPGSTALGTPQMLLVKPPTAQGGTPKFSTDAHYQSWPGAAPEKHSLISTAMNPLKTLPSLHPRILDFTHRNNPGVSPEVSPPLRRCNKSAASAHQRKDLRIERSLPAGTAVRGPPANS